MLKYNAAMKNLNRNELNTLRERLCIAASLLRYGVCVNLLTGKLFYLPYYPRHRCKSLCLIRHGKTFAIDQGEFMNNDSANSKLTKSGVKELVNLSESIAGLNPDVILVGPLERTLATYKVISRNIDGDPLVKECNYLLGINNSVWGGKTFEMLDIDDLCVFLLRECKRNIFVKTRAGDSWGDVLLRCTKLLRDIDKNYFGKNVLLVSQGSIYQGLKILLHKEKKPWDGYETGAMFGIVSAKSEKVGYGKIFRIY